MSKHWQTDLDYLHNEMLSMSARVEELSTGAVRSFRNRDHKLACEVIAADQEIDRREVRIEEECLKMLALHQPVAVDLRRVASVMKVNNDLERIADLAVNIAERTQSLCEYPEFPIPDKLDLMAELSMKMLRGSLDAFVNLDPEAARDIGATDDEVDLLNVEIIDELVRLMQERPENVSPGLHCFSAARQVERIADHATNIAEDVVYLVLGEIVRHQHAPQN